MWGPCIEPIGAQQMQKNMEWKPGLCRRVTGDYGA